MIRTETGDGATLAGRPELRTILEFIHPEETLVVTRIDRLARSMRDLQVIVATLQDKGAHLAATVDTSTAAGKAFFDMLGVFAEFETNLRRERQAEGITAAPIAGAHPGSTWKPSSISWPSGARRAELCFKQKWLAIALNRALTTPAGGRRPTPPDNGCGRRTASRGTAADKHAA